jgi:hypothetical protein
VADTVVVRGLRDVQKALRDVDRELGPELRKGLNEVAEIVASAARPLVPTRSGRARASIKVGSSQRAAQLKVGGTKAEYFPWLDFGGTVGRKHATRRPFIKEGRYIYPTLRKKRADVEDKLFEVVGRLTDRAGLGKLEEH